MFSPEGKEKKQRVPMTLSLRRRTKRFITYVKKKKKKKERNFLKGDECDFAAAPPH